MITFVHKLHVDNFSHLKHRTLPVLHFTDNYSPFGSAKFNLCLEFGVHHSEADGHKYVSVHLLVDNYVKDHKKLNFKVSIIGQGGVKCLTKDGFEVLHKVGKFGFDHYADFEQLLDQSALFLRQDRLTILCKIKIAENGEGFASKQFGKLMDKISQTKYIETSRFDVKSRPIWFNHMFTLENFSHLLKRDCVQGERSSWFSPPGIEILRFHIGLMMPGFFDGSKDFFFIYLRPEKYFLDLDDDVKFPFDKTVVRYRISVLDQNSNKCHFKIFQYELGKFKDDIKSLKYVILLSQLNEFAVNDKLTILCEAQAYISRCEIAKSVNLAQLSNQASPMRVTSSRFDAKPRVVDSFSYKMTFEKFKDLIEQNKTTFGCVESPKFGSKLNPEHRFRFQLFPNGSKKLYENNVTIYLIFDTDDEQARVTAQFKFSVLSKDGRKLTTSDTRYTFKYNSGMGWTNFLDHEYMRHFAISFLPNDTLTLLCEVDIIEDVK